MPFALSRLATVQPSPAQLVSHFRDVEMVGAEELLPASQRFLQVSPCTVQESAMSRRIGEHTSRRRSSPLQLAMLAAWIVMTACSMAPRAEPPSATGEPKSIGVATMGTDRTITLRLRAVGPDGLEGEGFFVYPPSHEQYQDVLDHLGGLEPGQSKPVPPFPDGG
jgi:hypothetical protein